MKKNRYVGDTDIVGTGILSYRYNKKCRSFIWTVLYVSSVCCFF